MGKRKPEAGVLPALWVLGGAFLLGGTFGCILAGTMRDGGELAAYLHSFAAAARAGTLSHPGVFSLLWEQVRWSLLAALLGMTALGLPGLPVLFAVRGFLLTYAAGSFVRVFGAAGSVLALSVLGLSALFALPSLFVLGVGAWGRLRDRLPPTGEAGRYLFCLCALCAGVALEYSVAPFLCRLAAGLVIV